MVWKDLNNLKTFIYIMQCEQVDIFLPDLQKMWFDLGHPVLMDVKNNKSDLLSNLSFSTSYTKFDLYVNFLFGSIENVVMQHQCSNCLSSNEQDINYILFIHYQLKVHNYSFILIM